MPKTWLNATSSRMVRMWPGGHTRLMSPPFPAGSPPELATLPSEKLVELTLADLRTLLGVGSQPVFAHSVSWPKAIPQYNVGYGRYKDLLSQIEVASPGLYFAGHYRDGISLGDSIVAGVNMAERVGKNLSATGGA